MTPAGAPGDHAPPGPAAVGGSGEAEPALDPSAGPTARRRSAESVPPPGARAPRRAPGTTPAWILAGIFAVVGVLHFVTPRAFERIMPSVVPRQWVGPLIAASGVAELACAGLLARPRTRRVGGWASAALLVAVYPANVQHALQGGLTGVDGFLGGPAVAWLRLPLQVPLIVLAVLAARRTPAASSRTGAPRGSSEVSA